MVSILVGTIMNALFIASITASITVFVIDEAANPERSRKVSMRTLISFLWAGLKMVAFRYKGSTISNTRVSFPLRANHITRIPLPPMVITPLVKNVLRCEIKRWSSASFSVFLDFLCEFRFVVTRALFQASSAHLHSANWPGNEAR